MRFFLSSRLRFRLGGLFNLLRCSLRVAARRGGQSISTAQQVAIKKLAVQIVEQMQSGW